METLDKCTHYRFILGSQSPRRKDLLASLGIPFEVEQLNVDESFDEALIGAEIPAYLSQKKAEERMLQLRDREVLITADTVVWINGHVLNKPADLDEAKSMLEEISGNQHLVFTGVTLSTRDRQRTFVEDTEVHFHPLTEREIVHYLAHWKPLDKAGAYGIQEFIGSIGIKAIHGDFYNVVGFPVQRFWRELDAFLDDDFR